MPSPADGRSPRGRLASFWLLYMAGLGIFFPFFSLYLSETLGLPAARVGIVAATLPLVGLLAQPLWGWVADRTGSRRTVLVLVTAGTALSTALLGLAPSFGTVWLAAFGVALFWTVVLPQATALTLAFRTIEQFPGIRVWGTIGFLLGVVGFPPLLAGFRGLGGPWSGLGWMFPAVAVVTLGAAAVAASLPDAAAARVRARPGEWRELLGRSSLRRLALVAFLAHGLGHGPIVLFPLLVAARGGGVEDVSSTWIWMLLVEIPLVAGAGRFLHRLGPRGLLQLGLLAEGARWLICGLSPSLQVVRAAMLLHGVAVTGILVGIPLYAERCAGPAHRSSAQALVSVTGLGLGAVVSDVVAGWAVERFGPDVPFALAGLGALAVAALVPLWLPRREVVPDAV